MSPAAGVEVAAEQAALIGRRVSINVASSDAARQPHLMRALAARLSDDRREVTVFLGADAARQVLDDVHANGRIAVVFSEPSTHQTVQLKGRDAREVPLLPGDLEHVQRHAGRFADELALIGYDRDLAFAILSHVPDDLVAVQFSVESVFEQTPGPRAGTTLAPHTV